MKIRVQTNMIPAILTDGKPLQFNEIFYHQTIFVKLIAHVFTMKMEFNVRFNILFFLSTSFYTPV